MRMRSALGAIPGFALAICICAAASAAGTGAAAERLVVSGTTLDVTRDPATGTPRTVTAVRSVMLDVSGVETLNRKGIEDAGGRLLSRYSELLRLRSDQIVLRDAEKSLGAWYVGFQQTVGGIPVFGSSLGFSIDRDGGIRSLGAVIYPDIPAPAPGKIGRDEALANARKRLREMDRDKHRLLAESTAILPERNDSGVSYRLVSIFNFFLAGTPRPEQATNGYAIFVDRNTGEIARVQPLVKPLGCCLPKDWTPPASTTP